MKRGRWLFVEAQPEGLWEERKCDHCSFPINVSYYSLGSATEALWHFCSEYCKNRWQDKNEGVDKVETKKEV